MFKSIRWQIAIPYIILILLVMTGLGIYLTTYFRKAQIDQLEKKMTSEAIAISVMLDAQINNGIYDSTLNEQVVHWANLLDARLTLILSDGTVLADSHENPSQMDNHLNRPEFIQSLKNNIGKSFRFSQTLGFDMMYLAVPMTDNEDILGVVRISLPLNAINDSIAQLQKFIAFSTLIGAIFSIILATIIAERTTRPIRKLTAAVQNKTMVVFDQEPLPVTQNEIGQLTQAYNQMSSQLHSHISTIETERSKFASVLQQMNDGVLIIDENGHIKLINPAAESMFDVHGHEVLNQSIAISLRQHKIIDLWRSCRKSSENQSATLELLSLGLYLHGSAIPLDDSQPGNTLLIFHDLTNIRRLETIRRDFISNISHELRTPLASLKALTETLIESALDDPQASRRFLQHMETEVDELSLMVQELVELSRIESGKVPLHLLPNSPANLLKTAMDRLGLQAERAGLTINLTTSDDLPNVLADQRRIEQVIVNLLHNAIKFSPDGGEIILGADYKEKYIQFFVKDRGIGIPKDDIDRIFERFFKSDRARSESGTGLGLAISRHLVEAHGGHIWAESTEGEGSTFYFTLPTFDGL